MKKPTKRSTNRKESPDPLEISVNGTEYVTYGGIFSMLEDPSHFKSFIDDISIRENNKTTFHRYYYVDDVVNLRIPEYPRLLASQQIPRKPQTSNINGFLFNINTFFKETLQAIRISQSYIYMSLTPYLAEVVELQGMFAIRLDRDALLRKFYSRLPVRLILPEGSTLDDMTLTDSFEAWIANKELNISDNSYLPKQAQAYISNTGHSHYFYYKKSEIITFIIESKKYKLNNQDTVSNISSTTIKKQCVDQNNQPTLPTLEAVLGYTAMLADQVFNVQGQPKKLDIAGDSKFPTQSAGINALEEACKKEDVPGYSARTQQTILAACNRRWQEILNERYY